MTRGVVDQIEQIPESKRNIYDANAAAAKLGTKGNPFLILEIVPYEEYAEFGYQISGCEPVNVEEMRYGDGDLTTVTSITGAKYEQKKAYFFPDEPEGDISKYSGNMRVCDDGMKDAEYTGYYERVKDGEGTFVQKIVKGEDGNESLSFVRQDHFQRTASYIWGSTTVTYSNSTEFTFAGAAAEKNSVTYSAEVRTMGNVTDYDRPFKVEIDKEMSTGIQGVHFDTNLDTLKIKAGKSNAYVRITFYRTPDLLDSTLTVVLHLIENEHFNARIDEYKKTNQWNSSSENLDGTRYTFKFNEQYSEPTYWSWFGEGFLGPWTPQKYIVVNSVMGWTVNDWSQAGQAGAKVSYGRLGFAAKAVRNYLQEQADNDTPVKDKDGSYMQLADGYTVDYSRYE